MYQQCETVAKHNLQHKPDRVGFHENGDTSQHSSGKAVTLPRVLVVDDERLIADTITQILNMHGFDAFCTYGGEEALHLAESFRPDYLLTDVMMPKLNGIDLAIAMERLFPSLKVLLFSGQAGATAAMQWQRASGTTFAVVAKPIHPEKLVMKLRTLQPRG
jgi:DNA-binding response OmpR family regulator